MSRLAGTGATLGAALLVGAVLAPAATAAQQPTGPVETYVVQARSGSITSVAGAVSHSGGKVLRTLPTLDSAIVRMPAAVASRWRSDGRVVSIVTDSRLHLLSDDSYDPSGDVNSLYSIEQTIGARSAWSKATGAGIDVALIDSGISPVAGLNSPARSSTDRTCPSTRRTTTCGISTSTAMARTWPESSPGTTPG